MNPSLVILEANLSDPAHQRDVTLLTLAYAHDPHGNSGPLADDAVERLIPGLQAHPTTHILLAYLDEQPVGIATCFRGFSTFQARPLLNLHDLAVLPGHRGSGVGRQLLAAVEELAGRLGCCKVTLEVSGDNPRARRTYEAAGFVSPGSAATGGSYFMVKPLGARDATA